MKSKPDKAPESPVPFETGNDLSKNARVKLSAILNQRLTDIIDLQTQLKQAHWNVKGLHFIGNQMKMT